MFIKFIKRIFDKIEYLNTQIIYSSIEIEYINTDIGIPAAAKRHLSWFL
jgi:hypothetical protein